MDSPTKLRKFLKNHTQGTKFGYGIDLKKKFKHLPCSAMFTSGIMCLFRLTVKIAVGESGTECLSMQPRCLRNRNAPLGNII